MYEIKLYNDWMGKVDEKVWKYRGMKKAMSPKMKIKEITKLILQCDVIKTNEEYTLYRLREKSSLERFV